MKRDDPKNVRVRGLWHLKQAEEAFWLVLDGFGPPHPVPAQEWTWIKRLREKLEERA